MNLHTTEVKHLPSLCPLLQAQSQRLVIIRFFSVETGWDLCISLNPTLQEIITVWLFWGLIWKLLVKFAVCFHVSKVFMYYNMIILIIIIFFEFCD